MDERMDHDRIIDEAADWADRMHELDGTEHGELATWLAGDPRCGPALDKMLRLLGDPALIEALGVYQPAPSATLAPMRESSPRRLGTPSARKGLSRRQALAAGLGAVLAVPVGWAALRDRSIDNADPSPAARLRFASAIGQHRKVSLPDGSMLLLDAGSEATVDFSGLTRRIALDEGAARFDVYHDPSRPFEVHVPNARITVLGTRFSVERLAHAAELRVFEGAVRFDPEHAPAMTVHAGQWALLADEKLTVGKGVGARADWQDDWLDAQQMPLGFALQRLNRYSRTPIRLDTPELADARFSGRFRLDDPQGTLTLIGALFGLEAVHRDGVIHLGKA